MKRTRSNSSSKISRSRKRRRLSLRKYKKSGKIIWDRMVAAGDTRNYAMKDPVIDWIKFQNKSNRSGANATYMRLGDNNSADTTFLMNKGVVFENAVIKYLKNKFPNDILDIDGVARSISDFNKTVNAMKSGVPIIYQGVLHDYKHGVYGIPDLIVRSDWIKKIVNNPPRKINSHRSAPLAKKKHYVIVDIKFSTLHLCADNRHLLNSGSIPAYKSQIWIYTKALGVVQGYRPKYGFVMGRRWEHKYQKAGKWIIANGNNCMDRLGVINFSTKDSKYKQISGDAVDWIRRLRKNGHKWRALPRPSVPELYPNMSNQNDGEYRAAKKEIADKLDEITLVWQCGPVHRERAHSHNVFKWSNPKLTPELMGFASHKNRTKILQQVLDVNRMKPPVDKHDNVWPTAIQNNVRKWQNVNKNEMYIDIEMVSNIATDCQESFPHTSLGGISKLVCMIGVGYVDTSVGGWVYKNFTANTLTVGEESRIVGEFYKLVSKASGMYHWGHVEKTELRKAFDRANMKSHFKRIESKFFNFLDVMYAEPIVIRGALSFGLKAVVKALYEHNLIDTTWDSETTGGLEAMFEMVKIYHSSHSSNLEKLPKMKDIIRYNEIDCLTVYKIIDYLRTYHNMDAESSNKTESSEDPDTSGSEWQPGQCCFCGGECNPMSQSCGACPRGTYDDK